MKIRRLFIILFCLNLLNYIDRQVLYSVFPLLQTDLHLTDLQLGTLASAFMLVYMCYAPVMGFLADRLNRPKLIAWSAFLWSGATLACGVAKNYVSLLIPRALVGVGEGGFTTLAQPFLAEHAPKEKHASLLAAFGLALPIGSALGYMLGGFIGQRAGWRVAFMLAGVAGLFFAILAGTLLKDKAREHNKAPRPTIHEYFPLFKNRPFLCICVAQAMMTFVMGGLAAWMPMYLHRYVGLDVAQAGVYFGALVIAGGAAGTYWGGVWAARLLQRTAKAYYWVTAGCFVAALPFCWLSLVFSNRLSVLVCLGLALILLFMPTGAIAAALVATTDQKIRSMAFAVNIFIIHLLGDALSPTLIGWASDQWGLKVAIFGASLLLLPGAWAGWKARS